MSLFMPQSGPAMLTDGKASPKEDLRSVVRKKATGRVKLAVNNQLVSVGRLFDISPAGLGVFVDTPISGVRSVLAQVDSFTCGRRYVITGPAIINSSVLTGNQGQKVGLSWGTLDAASAGALQQLFAALD